MCRWWESNPHTHRVTHFECAASAISPHRHELVKSIINYKSFGGTINTSKTARTAIVAEDEALIRLDIVEILKDHGFDIIAETGNGEDAVRLVRELKPGLLVMDIKMPKLDGLSAAKKITEETVTPIVFLTAFSQKSLWIGQLRQALWHML